LCRRLRGQKSGSKHGNVVKRTQSVKNIRRNYCESSPRVSTAYSCDSDSSIYEAVLHCKRSIGMSKKNLNFMCMLIDRVNKLLTNFLRLITFFAWFIAERMS